MYERKIGASVLNVWPFSMIPVVGSLIATVLLKDMGIQYVQLVPFWTVGSLEARILNRYRDQVISIDVWPRAKEFRTWMTRYAWYYRLLFGSEWNVARVIGLLRHAVPKAVVIDHEPNIECAEVSPWHSIESFYRYLLSFDKLAIDIFHLLEFKLPLSDLIAFVDRTIDQVKIAVIHVQFREQDKLEEFLNGEGDSFQLLRACLQSNWSVPVVIELPFMLVYDNRDIHRRIADKIREIDRLKWER